MNANSIAVGGESRFRLMTIDLRLGWVPMAALLCGIGSARAVNLIGEFYVGELLIIQLALMLMLFGRDRSLLDVPAFGIFAQTAVLMLAGYIISDIFRDTHPGQFLRGWARVIVLVLDFIALSIIVARDRRNLWWFVLGMGVGGMVQLLVRGVPIMSAAGWKFGYATPIVYLLCCLAYLLPVKLACLAFAGVGVWNIFMDFRIMGAICLLIAAVLWVRAAHPQGLSGMHVLKLVLAGTIAAAVIAAALMATEEEFGKRREVSNVGREAGLVVAVRGIVESPLIGYGSWPNDPMLVSLYREQVIEEGQEAGAAVNAFTAHSQVLQAWIEGGVLAALFWLYYGVKLVTGGWYTTLRRKPDGYFPIFMFFLTYNLWNFFMSPFSGPTRLPIAVGIAVICLISMEMVQAKRQPAVTARASRP